MYFFQELEGKDGILTLYTSGLAFLFNATHVILIGLNLRIPWLAVNATHVILIGLNLRIPWPQARQAGIFPGDGIL